MNDNAKKWVAALRSGEYKQAQNQLRTDEGYCCLGVACELALEAGAISSYNPEGISLPFPVQKWLGLASPSGRYGHYQFLTNDNDRLGKSFSEIADIIENEQSLFGLPGE